MATYTDPSTIGTSPNDPVTSEFGTAALDNPIAIAEGAFGAPINQTGWYPYNLTTVGGTEDGVIYDFTVDGAVTILDSPDFVDGYEYGFLFRNMSSTAALTVTMQLEREDNNTYSAAETIMTTLSAVNEVSSFVQVLFPRVGVASRTSAIVTTSDTSAPATASFNGEVPSRKMLSARFNFSGGSLDAGSVVMVRRREFISG